MTERAKLRDATHQEGAIPSEPVAPSRAGGPVSGVQASRKGPGVAFELAPHPQPHTPISPPIPVQLSELVALDIREAHTGRQGVAAAIGISVTRLNKWSARSKPDELPTLALLPDYVRATGSPRLLRWACEAAGYYLADERDELARRVGEAFLRGSAAFEEARELAREWVLTC